MNNASPVQYSQGDDVESFIHRAVLSTAAAAVKARDILVKSKEMEEDACGDAIINRILRGVLWTIHNQNAPGLDPLAERTYRDASDRSLECSLSSKWLDGSHHDIVYIS